MHPRTSALGVTLMCSILTSVAVVGSAWSQPGTVLTHSKINSDALALVGAPLDDADEFGDAVASLGDLDGPGPSVVALAVGAVGDDDGGSHHGAVYVVFLNAAGGVLSYQKISSTQGNFTGLLDVDDEFGGAIAGLGDLDGPGPSVAALAVGVIGDDDGGAQRGATYILFLGSTGTVLSHRKISNTQGNFTAPLDNNDNFGEDVASLGDLDGPGPSVAALASSAVDDDDGGHDRGAVYVLFLESTGSVLSYRKISSTQGNFAGSLADDDNFGTAVAGLGDLDGPGPSIAALAVGAGSDDGAGSDRGAVYMLFLDGTGNVLSYQEVSSTAGNFGGKLDDTDEFGSALVALGDIDGNGPAAQTLVSAASFDDDGGTDRGAVYVLSLAGSNMVAVDDSPAGARLNGLSHVRPNPFKRSTTIPFRISEAGQVHIDILDVRGRTVREVVQEQAASGEHRVVWDGLDDSGRPLAPGTYFLRMSVNGQTMTTGAKAVLLR